MTTAELSKEKKKKKKKEYSIEGYKLYRNTTIGICLKEALNELAKEYGKEVTEDVREGTLLAFEKAFSEHMFVDNSRKAIGTKRRAALTGKLDRYQQIDEYWVVHVGNGKITLPNGGTLNSDSIEIIGMSEAHYDEVIGTSYKESLDDIFDDKVRKRK